ncbi:MAG: DNA helicase [Clostridium sp.]|jgi:ATP-dependent DNA helicase RecG|nr:DNA helicase [Clostridium sp.]
MQSEEAMRPEETDDAGHRIHDDVRIAELADVSQFRPDMIVQYIAAVKKEKKHIARLSGKQILDLMGIVRDGKPTLAGVLCFSEYPQAVFPQLCITAVVVPGFKMGDKGPDGERFSASRRIEGTIKEMTEEAVLFAERNMRTKIMIEHGQRKDKMEYPANAVREAILNALVHRDYSSRTEGMPVRVLMFNDRMEIWNEAGSRGWPNSDRSVRIHVGARNQVLANILEIQKAVENRCSGISVIREEMAAYHLPEPVFENRHGNFVVTLKNGFHSRATAESGFHHSATAGNGLHANAAAQSGCVGETDSPEFPASFPDLSEGGGYSEQDDIALFCRTPRTRAEIAARIGKTQYYTVKTVVQPLIDSGRLKMTIPDKPKSRNQKYYSG